MTACYKPGTVPAAPPGYNPRVRQTWLAKERAVRAVTLILLGLAVLAGGPARGAPPAVAELFEDDAENFLKLLTNPTGDPGEGHPEKDVVFSGKAAVRIVPMQRFSPVIPGWKYPIAEKPKDGEYRYLRF